jgi:hypothetical protein
VDIIDTIEHDRSLPPLSRQFAEHEGIAYPPYNELNRDYIDHLTTPRGDSTTYDTVFNQALKNITASWENLRAALTANAPTSFSLPNADLDTGLQDRPMARRQRYRAGPARVSGRGGSTRHRWACAADRIASNPPSP